MWYNKVQNLDSKEFIILSYLHRSGMFVSGDLVLACLTLIQKKETVNEEDIKQTDFFKSSLLFIVVFP